MNYHVASLGHRIAPLWPVSRDWQGQIQCHFGVGLSNEHEDDQVNVFSPNQVNGRMLGLLDPAGRYMLESPE